MSNRLLRVNALLQREISAYLHTKYPSETVALTITGADVTGDLREARIFYTVLGGEEQAERGARWLKRKVSEIRSMVARNVVMRHVPALTFVHDTSGRRAVRIEQLLDELGGSEQDRGP